MKEKVSYKVGEFDDYQGKTHKFVVAAVSTTNLTDGEGSLYLSLVDNYDGELVDEIELSKALFIGIAVCNPLDEFDEEKGKMIAYNKAINAKDLNHPAVFSTRSGYINTEVVEALLNNIVKYVAKDPGSVIAGYDDAKRKYLKRIKDENFVTNSSPHLKELANAINNLTDSAKKDLSKLIDLTTA